MSWQHRGERAEAAEKLLRRNGKCVSEAVRGSTLLQLATLLEQLQQVPLAILQQWTILRLFVTRQLLIELDSDFKRSKQHFQGVLQLIQLIPTQQVHFPQPPQHHNPHNCTSSCRKRGLASSFAAYPANGSQLGWM